MPKKKITLTILTGVWLTEIVVNQAWIWIVGGEMTMKHTRVFTGQSTARAHGGTHGGPGGRRGGSVVSSASWGGGSRPQLVQSFLGGTLGLKL